MRLRSDILTRLVLLSFLGLAVSCDTTVQILNQPGPPLTGEDPPVTQEDPPEEPQPLDISGSWDTYAVETADTCGFDPPEPYAPALIEENGGQVTVTFGDGSGGCQESTRVRSGDTVTLTRSDVLDLDGASVRMDLSIVYDFTEDGFSGTATQSFTDLSGTFTDLPCAVTLAVTGTRCTGCWTGCSSTQGGPGNLEIPDIESRFEELAGL